MELNENETRILMKYIDQNTKVVYHEVNEKIETHIEPLKTLCEKAIENEEPVLAFERDHSQYGCDFVRIYLVNDILIVRTTSRPNPGYIWQERKIELMQ